MSSGSLNFVEILLRNSIFLSYDKIDIFFTKIRYDINPSCSAEHIECNAHIEHCRGISKIRKDLYRGIVSVRYNAISQYQTHQADTLCRGSLIHRFHRGRVKGCHFRKAFCPLPLRNRGFCILHRCEDCFANQG